MGMMRRKLIEDKCEQLYANYFPSVHLVLCQAAVVFKDNLYSKIGISAFYSPKPPPEFIPAGRSRHAFHGVGALGLLSSCSSYESDFVRYQLMYGSVGVSVTKSLNRKKRITNVSLLLNLYCE